MLKTFGLLAGLAGLLAPPLATAAQAPGDVVFEPCTLSALGDAWVEPARCARIAVPEDHDDPDGRRIELDVARVPARRPSPLADPVVFLAGGPGQSAIEAYPQIAQAFERLRRDRDILLIDQRGTGGSNALRCPLPEAEAQMDPSEAELRALALDCLSRVQGRADVRHYTTVDSVRDLESVRRQLGLPALNLVGGSYGTRVALEFLRRYPDSVRSVVLDGVVPPALALGQDHARNLESALQTIFAACAGSPDCRDRYGDPRETLKTLRARLARAPMRAWIRDPRTYERHEATLSDSVLAGVLRFYAYQPEFSSLLPLLLDRAVHDDPAPLITQGQRLFEDIGRQIAWGLQLSVMCSEDADLLKTDPADEGSLLGNSFQTLARAQCAVWPHKARPADFHDPVVSDKPVLLLSGEWDPVTPPRYGETVRQHLSQARHLVVAGSGHITMGRGCMPKLVEQFVDRASAADLDAECLEVLRPPPFFLNFQGSAP